MIRSLSNQAKARRPATQPVSDELLVAVGRFLAENDLAPTPGNYANAYGIVTGTQQVRPAVELAAPEPAPAQLSRDDLAKLLDDIQSRFDQFAHVADRSRADVSAFGQALERSADDISVATAQVGVAAVAMLLDVTRSMITQAKQAEERFAATSAEMRDLRHDLDQARRDARTDPLTGLPNRRAIAQRFDACRNDGVLPQITLGLCDIDRFKRVNDDHGHEVGDRVLKLVAKELVGGCPHHMVGRHGGEEFIVLFEDIDSSAAARILDDIRESLSHRILRVSGSNQPLGKLTFSAGVVTLAAEEGLNDGLRRADTALYHAKANGRNRIEIG